MILRHFILLLFIFFSIKLNAQLQDSCNSNYTRLLSFKSTDPNRQHATRLFKMMNGKKLIATYVKVPSCSDNEQYISYCDKNLNAYWSINLAAVNNGLCSLSIVDAIETREGNIVLFANCMLYIQPSCNIKDIFQGLILIDKSGNILKSVFFKKNLKVFIPVSPLQIEPEIAQSKILETPDNQIVLVLPHEDQPAHNFQGFVLAAFDKNINPIWSTHYVGSDELPALHIISAHLSGNDLRIYCELSHYRAKDPSFDFNPAMCSDKTRFSLACLKIKLASIDDQGGSGGQSIHLKSYCFDFAFHPFDSSQFVFSGGGVQLLNNGTAMLTKFFPAANGNSPSFLFTVWDTAKLSILKSKAFYLPAQYSAQNAFWPEKNVITSANGYTAILAINKTNSADNIIIVLDSSLNVVSQKYISNLSSGFIGSTYTSILATNDDNTVQMLSDKGGKELDSLLMYKYGIYSKDITCNVNDTTIGNLKIPTFNLSKSNPQFIYSVESDILTLYSLNVTSQKVDNHSVIQKCPILSDHNNIIIYGASSICSKGRTYRYELKSKDPINNLAWQFSQNQNYQTIYVSDSTIDIVWQKSGVFAIVASATTGCYLSLDTLNVTVSIGSQPVDIGSDTMVCNGTLLKLSAGSHYKSYSWSTNETSESIVVNSAGKYFVSVSDSCSTISSDTVIVAYPTKKLEVSASFSICEGEDTIIVASDGFKSYQWSNGDFLSPANSQQVSIRPEHNNVYIINATDESNCLYIDSVTISTIKCPVKFYIPTSFSPNNDNLNDTFKPIFKVRPIELYFEIFNRWGQIVYNTTNSQKGWDGKYKGINQPLGTYTWQCIFQFKNELPQRKSGTVLLVR